MSEKEKTVNVTPSVAGQLVKEELDGEALDRGMKSRPFVGTIYAYAVNNKDIFNGRLKKARAKNGSHIGAVTDQITAEKLTVWAKEKKSSRGLLCNHILERAIEENLFDQIFK